MEINVRNVNEALNEAVKQFACHAEGYGYKEVAPRGMRTYEWNEPVTTIYHHPWERVLFSEVRDANPFFHFFEPLWMLAGRNDVAFVSTMVKRMATYSDDGATLRGAYGHRWRAAFGPDQIAAAISQLTKDPDSRRVVIGMWSPHRDLGVDSKDIPCNTQIYLKVRDGRLRLTVTCRSNDIVWGAYGANATQFSVLQEYIAGKLGLEMGPLTTLSDSWHVYLDGEGGDVWNKLATRMMNGELVAVNRYHRTNGGVKHLPMGCGDPAWDNDLERFFLAFDKWGAEGPCEVGFKSRWWRGVAGPMWRAWQRRDFNEAEAVLAEDWRLEAVRWLEKRVKREAW